MGSQEIPELTDRELEDFTKEGFSLIDFFAECSMSCLMTSPIVDEIAEKFDDYIKAARVNVEDYPEFVNKFNINGPPCVIFVKDGEVVDNISGSFCQEEVEERLKECLKKFSEM